MKTKLVQTGGKIAGSYVLKTDITDYTLELPVCLLPTRGSRSGWIFLLQAHFLFTFPWGEVPYTKFVCPGKRGD